MDDLSAGIWMGGIGAAVAGFIVWGSLGANWKEERMLQHYGQQHCEAKCAPQTPKYEARIENGKFSCYCIVPKE